MDAHPALVSLAEAHLEVEAAEAALSAARIRRTTAERECRPSLRGTVAPMTVVLGDSAVTISREHTDPVEYLVSKVAR